MKKLISVVCVSLIVLGIIITSVCSIQGKEVEIVPTSEVDRSGFNGAVPMRDIDHTIHSDEETYEWLQENKIKFRGKTLP